ncbi:MAG: Maf family protein, partial [Erysipelotrichaceae bacterium]|nr:Maf family protein [Erysipelotrichaceae bacterium]
LSEAEIEEYISSDEPYDKAGGYAIQGRSGVFIREIRGNYYNVVGLPVDRIYGYLKKRLSLFPGE